MRPPDRGDLPPEDLLPWDLKAERMESNRLMNVQEEKRWFVKQVSCRGVCSVELLATVIDSACDLGFQVFTLNNPVNVAVLQ